MSFLFIKKRKFLFFFLDSVKKLNSLSATEALKEIKTLGSGILVQEVPMVEIPSENGLHSK